MSACERSTTGMENILGHCTDEGARRTKAHIPQARTQKESGTKYTREEEKGGGRRKGKRKEEPSTKNRRGGNRGQWIGLIVTGSSAPVNTGRGKQGLWSGTGSVGDGLQLAILSISLARGPRGVTCRKFLDS